MKIFLRLIPVLWCDWHDQRGQIIDQCTPLGFERKRGEFAQAAGRSRGGRATKIHALTDEIGRPVALGLTPGQARELTGAAELLTRIPTPRQLLADRAYDARRLHDWLAERGCEAVIPPNPTCKHPHSCDKTGYGGRNVVERMFATSRISAE